MKKEINSLNKNHTWSLVELPEGKKAIGCKWTFKIKKDANGKIHRYKARLVAKGYAQTHGVDYYETYSPVTNITTICSLLAIANNRKMHIHQMDVHTAFLNGILDEEVYMCKPEGYRTNTNLVCKLRKSSNGLKQAARVWNYSCDQMLAKNGFNHLKSDNCVYKNSNDSLFIATYIDDI